ncbi:hypothetical protein QUF72_08195, partial [Desulfobacterales bacterium HSG2]|nr:hypothetical protein [Desulfobacterales bacterium HSG2]
EPVRDGEGSLPDGFGSVKRRNLGGRGERGGGSFRTGFADSIRGIWQSGARLGEKPPDLAIRRELGREAFRLDWQIQAAGFGNPARAWEGSRRIWQSGASMGGKPSDWIVGRFKPPDLASRQSGASMGGKPSDWIGKSSRRIWQSGASLGGKPRVWEGSRRIWQSGASLGKLSDWIGRFKPPDLAIRRELGREAAGFSNPARAWEGSRRIWQSGASLGRD